MASRQTGRREGIEEIETIEEIEEIEDKRVMYEKKKLFHFTFCPTKLYYQ